MITLAANELVSPATMCVPILFGHSCDILPECPNSARRHPLLNKGLWMNGTLVSKTSIFEVPASLIFVQFSANFATTETEHFEWAQNYKFVRASNRLYSVRVFV